MKILRDAISVAPDNEVPETPGAQLEELAEQDQHTSVVDVERNLGRNMSKREEKTTVHICKNETTSAKERAECEEDDRVSAESSATPLDLSQLDDSLFAESRTRKKLTKKEK